MRLGIANFFQSDCTALFKLGSTQSTLLYVMAMNRPQCLLRERPLRYYSKAHAHCHILVYFYGLYFYSQEKCYSANKIITSFPVTAMLVFCTSRYKNYRASGSTPCPSDSPLGTSINLPAQGRDPVTSRPSLSSSYQLSHYQILLISVPKFILNSSISALSNNKATPHSSASTTGIATDGHLTPSLLGIVLIPGVWMRF